MVCREPYQPILLYFPAKRGSFPRTTLLLTPERGRGETENNPDNSICLNVALVTENTGYMLFHSTLSKCSLGNRKHWLRVVHRGGWGRNATLYVSAFGSWVSAQQCFYRLTHCSAFCRLTIWPVPSSYVL